MKNRLKKKKAKTTYPVHDVIARRWSGRAFSDEEIDGKILGSLFEAARWAP
jgi:nitroreductase